MRKPALLIAICFMLVACANNEEKGEAATKNDTTKTGTAKDSTKKSIPSEVTANVGNTALTIAYHSPAVRGRVIWGGLVPYDAVWVTGAHKATTLEAGKDFVVGNKTIPAGKYALFSIPGRDEWTLIINRNWNQHLADDYNEAEDVIRINVKPQKVAEHTERLKWEINPVGDKAANIIISWEKLRVPFELVLK